MAEERNDERENPLWKWLSLSLVAVLLGGALWLHFPSVLADPLDNTSEMECSAAVSFAGGELPEGATDGRCTERSWMDVTVEGSFRMPRSDVAAWLDASFPGSREHAVSPASPASPASGKGDMRVHAEPLPADARASAMDLTVVHEGKDTALIRFTAFTT